MKRFEVGKTYGAYDSGIPSITVVRRTERSIYLTNGIGNVVRQKVHVDEDGYEYTYDSYAPLKWRQAYTHSTRFEE